MKNTSIQRDINIGFLEPCHGVVTAWQVTEQEGQTDFQWALAPAACVGSGDGLISGVADRYLKERYSRIRCGHVTLFYLKS